MRAPQARRHGAGDRLQRRSRPRRRRPSRTRASSICTSSISTAPSPAERQRRGGRGHPARRRRSRSSSAAASARWPISRPGSTRAWPASSSAPSPCAIPSWCSEACKAFPGQVAVGIDAKGGKVAVEGWAETSELDVDRTGQRFEGAGVAAIIYTDIDRDGMLAGINWDSTHRAGRCRVDPGDRLGRPRLDGRHRAHDLPDARMLEGAISGRALYDGRIDSGAWRSGCAARHS